MINRYAKGRRLEYKIVKQLKSEGYIAQRMAGSHSPIDILAIHPEKKVIKLIQCKSGQFREAEKRKLLEEHKDLNGSFETIFSVVTD